MGYMVKSVVWFSLADYDSYHDNQEMFSIKTTLWFFISVLLQSVLCVWVWCVYMLSSPRYSYARRHTDQTNLSRETCDGTSACKPDPLFAGEAKQAVLTNHSDVIWENLISVCGGGGNVAQPDWGIPTTHSEDSTSDRKGDTASFGILFSFFCHLCEMTGDIKDWGQQCGNEIHCLRSGGN